MLHNKFNKDSSINQSSISRQVSTYRSQRKGDDHGNDRQLRNMRRCHHSPKKYTRRNHESLGLGRIPSVYCVCIQRIRHEAYIFQGDLRKIKPPTYNGEHWKGEEAEAWLLESNKYL